MEIFVNHSPVEVAVEATVAEVLSQENIPAEGTAVAIENRVVPRSEWSTTRMQPGARLTVIRAVCGG